jgi:addiction module HigA family antidote
VIPNRRVPCHPGEILLEEFLVPLGLTQVEFAAHLGIPLQRLNGIVRGKRGVSSDSAWLFAQSLGTSPEFWINLQSSYDLARTRPTKRIRPVRRVG